MHTWGSGTNGKIGNLTSTGNKSYPTSLGTDSWTTVSTGSRASHMAAVRSDGALFTWGLNSNGELGLGVSGTINNRSSPVQVGFQSWTYLASGNGYTIGLNNNQSLFYWGKASVNGVGILSTIVMASPTFIRTVNEEYTSILAGPINSAIRKDGALIVWGLNSDGQLGVNNRTDEQYPRRLGNQSWITVSSDTNYATFAIRNDKTLWAWGRNTNQGLLGLNSVITNRSSPVQVGALRYSYVDGGNVHAAAVRTDGVLSLWGWNNSGQLGIGDVISRSSPTQLGTLADYAVSTTTPVSPTQIGSLGWSKVSAGTSYSMAIRSDNALFAWGASTNALMVGSPTQVLGYSATQISAGLRNFGFISTSSE